MKKRLIGFLVIILCAFVLVGCGKGNSYKVWSNYVKAVNKGNITQVAETFYDKKTEATNYETFISDNTYLNDLKKVKTLKYEEDICCDFSSQTMRVAYYHANVEAEITTTSGKEKGSFELYYYENANGIFFCTPVELVDSNNLGNKSNTYYDQKVYMTEKDYSYREEEDKVIYISQNNNVKDLVIPETINNKPVTEIAEYACFKYNKILCFTLRSSKMTSVKIPATVETIGKYAFYQCVKLQSLDIPSSVNYIDRMAFSGCKSIKEVVFEHETNNVSYDIIPSVSTGVININNARNLLVGDIMILTTDDDSIVLEWSVSDTGVASIDASTGKLTARNAGTVTITACQKTNPNNNCQVTITVSTPDVLCKISSDAFNRLDKLEKLTLKATNPTTIKIDGSVSFALNKTCKIYIPKGSMDSYLASDAWKAYAGQLVEY